MADNFKRQVLFCYPFNGVDRIKSALEKELRKTGFNAAENVIEPDVTAKNPLATLKLRLAILLNAYRGDYHTDAFDFDRLSENIATGTDAVWFWGGKEEIAKARLMFDANPVSNDELQDPALGTVSLLNAEKEFGAGHAELCRSGSTDRITGAKGFILYRTLKYMRNDTSFSSRYHSLVLVPRNRITTASIRGGEAVHTLHTHYARSRFWGFAPWYLMQGNNVEMLDFRECNRNPEDVANSLRESSWFLANEEEGSFCSSLCQLNFNISPKILIVKGRDADGETRCDLLMPRTKDLISANHSVIIPSLRGMNTLENALQAVNDAQPCCSVIRLDLSNRWHSALQAHVYRLGYRLTAVLPPKKTWIRIDGAVKKINVGGFGFWSLPRKREKIVLPYYIRSKTRDAKEKAITDYLRTNLCSAFDNPISE